MLQNIFKILKENLQAAMGWMSVDGRGLAVPSPNQVSITNSSKLKIIITIIIAIIIVIIVVDGGACF